MGTCTCSTASTGQLVDAQTLIEGIRKSIAELRLMNVTPDRVEVTSEQLEALRQHFKAELRYPSSQPNSIFGLKIVVVDPQR